MAAPKKKTGRPSTYNKEQVETIIARVSGGETLKAVCRDLGIPPSTFHEWRIVDHDGLADRYARAREAQAEAWADEIIEVAYDTANDSILKGEAEIEVPNTEWITRSRLKVDTLKWLMAKQHPKAYGEKIEQQITGAAGEPLVIRWEA